MMNDQHDIVEFTYQPRALFWLSFMKKLIFLYFIGILFLFLNTERYNHLNVIKNAYQHGLIMSTDFA